MTTRVLATAISSALLLSLGSSSVTAVASSQPQLEVRTPTFLEIAKEKSRDDKVARAVKMALTRVGQTPYVFSGSSTRGWDCSGLVRWMYERLGVGVPHSAHLQGHLGQRVTKPKVGDIVVFARKGSTNFYHSGIYVGGRKILNANQYFGSTLVQPLSDYKTDQVRFVRVNLNCWKNYRTEHQAITNCEQ
jgi:cell wall-associated NlpC family hydrolase